MTQALYNLKYQEFERLYRVRMRLGGKKNRGREKYKRLVREDVLMRMP